MTIGQRIKQRRLELGLTQTELAERMGYTSRTSICTVEKDKEDLTTTRVKKFAEALETTPSDLMGWTENHEAAHLMFDWNEFLRENPNEAVDAYVFNDNNGVIELKEDEVNVAVKLYELYKKADPTVKSAIDTLLKKN